MASAVMQSPVSPGGSGHDAELDGTHYGERCSCCPYGYHIDLDFLRYLDTLYSGESLKSLRRIRHGRSGGLNVSTSDGFLSDDELSRWRLMSLSPVHSPPPRSASSSSRVTTDEILMEIDSSINPTLRTIDNEVDTRVVRKKKPPRPLPESRPKENGYRTAVEEQRVEQLQQSRQYTEVTNTTVTSNEIADKFTGLMSGTASPVVGGRPAEQATSTISPEILQAIREQMAASLQRMRELEDQVRVMPVMEDQISTLRRENKRLYHLLSRLTEDERAGGMPAVNGDAGLQVQGDENVRTFRGEQGSILVELPVKIGKDSNKDIYDGSSYSMHSTETRTEVRETNTSARRAFFWGTSDDADATRLSPESFRLFKPSRTIGVGDGNVFESGYSVEWPTWRKTRDIGVHCLPASRDVSVSVSESTGVEQQQQQQQDDDSGGARVSLTVTVSDERRVCEPRWEVERFGTGLYQSVAIQCLIIGGFLPSDRPHMSENVDGWLVETNKLWTYSAADEPLPLSSTHTRLEYEEKQHATLPDYSPQKDVFNHEQSMSAAEIERQSASLDRVLDKLCQTMPQTKVLTPLPDHSLPQDSFVQEQSLSAVKIERQSASLDSVLDKLYQTKPESEVHTTLPDHSLPKDSFVQEQSMSAVKIERQSASLDSVLVKLYQSKPESEVDDSVREEKAVPARANLAVFDLNASFRKLQEAAEAQDQDHVVKEEIIVAQSKPRASSSCTDKASSSSAFDFGASLAKLQEVQEQTVEEDVIVRQSAAPRASSHHVDKLSMEDVVNKQGSSDSRLMAETKETVVMNKNVETLLQRDEKESSVDSTGVQPFPPHLSRITASSVSDDDALNDQQQQHDVTVLETAATPSVTVVEATNSSQPGTVAVEQKETSVFTTQTSSVPEGEVVVTKTEVTREVTEVITGSEVTTSSVETVSTFNSTSGSAESTQVLSQDLIDASDTASTVITTEVGEVQQQQQSSGEMGSVIVSKTISELTDVKSESETLPVSSQETDHTMQHTESTVVTAELGGVQQLAGEVVRAAEVGDVTTDATADQSQGCHVIITETRIERQLIGCKSDQSQPVVIVPEDTVIHTSVTTTGDELTADILQQPDSSVTNTFSADGFEHSEVLSDEMMKACLVYSQSLVDASTVTDDEKKSSIDVIQKNWFSVSSRKSSTAAEVQSYLSAFEHIQLPLLFAIVNLADTDGNTALHYAVSQCNIGIMQTLLDTGVCDVRRQNRAGYTAIMLASLLIIDADTHRDIIRRLFIIGDVNVKSATSGQTALMLAASHGRCDMVELLIDAGADVNARDEDGSTALMCACEHGYIDIVQMLLSHPECDSSLADVDGSTALSIAMDEGHRDIGVLLYAHMNTGRHSSPQNEETNET